MRTVLQTVRRIANEIFGVKGLRKPLASLQGRVFILFKTIWQIKVKKNCQDSLRDQNFS